MQRDGGGGTSGCRGPRRLAAAALIVILSAAISGCQNNSKPAPPDPLEKGRALYTANCAVCHNADPNQSGPLGPPIAGAPRALVEARVLHATYPPGYKPKRASRVMQPLPWLAPNIDQLTAFLDAAAQQHGIPAHK
jgi:mono/diheme cytochrome c family protein